MYLWQLFWQQACSRGAAPDPPPPSERRGGVQMADSRLLTLWFQEARICNTVWCYWRLDVALITATEAGGGKGGRGKEGGVKVWIEWRWECLTGGYCPKAMFAAPTQGQAVHASLSAQRWLFLDEEANPGYLMKKQTLAIWWRSKANPGYLMKKQTLAIWWRSKPWLSDEEANPDYLMKKQTLAIWWRSKPWLSDEEANPGYLMKKQTLAIWWRSKANPGYLMKKQTLAIWWRSKPWLSDEEANPDYLMKKQTLAIWWRSKPWLSDEEANPGYLMKKQTLAIWWRSKANPGYLMKKQTLAIWWRSKPWIWQRHDRHRTSLAPLVWKDIDSGIGTDAEIEWPPCCKSQPLV